MSRNLRVAAYAVCVRDGQVLLARWVSRAGARNWTLPGGGMEYGEDPHRTVIREVEEETGYAVEPHTLLGVDSVVYRRSRRFGGVVPGGLRQGLRIVYEARIVGGELRNETDGSTDLAAWHPLDAVPGLDRVALVDVGLALWRHRPADGRAPVPAAGDTAADPDAPAAADDAPTDPGTSADPARSQGPTGPGTSS